MDIDSSLESDARHNYTERRAARAREHILVDRVHWRIGMARLGGLGLSFLLGLGLIGGATYSAWWLLAPLVGVFFLGVWLDRVEKRRSRLERAIAFYERGLARLDDNWAGTGPDGARFLNGTDHLYATDLDVFGHGSIFQLLCGARTRMGESTLAGWLLSPATRDVVRQRQEAVDELVADLDLREDLAVLGDDVRARVDDDGLRAWIGEPAKLDTDRHRRVAQAATGAAGLALVALVIFVLAVDGSITLDDGIVTVLRWYVIASLAAAAIVSARFARIATRIYAGAGLAARDIELLAEVLARLEGERFRSPYLADVRAALDADGDPPSRRIRRLTKLVELVQSRRNMFAALFWFLLALDVHLAYAVERWRLTSGPAVGRWLDAVGTLEAVSSLAGYRYEHPDYVWPVLEEGGATFDASALAHPLLGPEAVANDVQLDGTPQLLIVSGSNMSGKSTLLRTVGLGAVLAQAGAPVRATSLRLSPLAVGASIQLNDSIQQGNSRFYTEVKRLQALIAAAESSSPLLFLIDECLHGTNSHDRRIGAEAIVRALADRHALGLVTTHDLALTDMEASLGSRAANVHFVDTLDGDQLSFDYTMRPGVVQRSNAIALMRSVGIDV